jgi:RNA 2',3'-cyclic 3'-phosphodiesterase
MPSPEPLPTRRLFFGFWPDETQRAEFVHATRKAVRACGGRPVPAENLHATVLFLGSVLESNVPVLTALAARAAAQAQPLDLVFEQVEFWEKPRVLVATTSPASAAGHAVAEGLNRTLERETSRAGMHSDVKPFHVHVTLARKVGRVTHELAMQPVRWWLSELALIDSRTDPEGPVYTVLESFPLGTASRQPP